LPPTSPVPRAAVGPALGVASFLACALLLAAGCAGSASGGGAASASATTAEDTPVTFDATVADPDPGDTHVLSVVTQPGHGTAQVIANRLVYTPDADFNGTDSFLFRATDSAGHAFTGTATVTVTAVNDPPTAASCAIVTAEDVDGAATPTVSDPDGETTFTLTIEDAPHHGAAAAAGDQLSYTPDADFSGSDPFTFRATDAAGGYVDGTCTVSVTAVNDAPTAAAVSVFVAAGQTVSVTPTVTDPDPGDTHTFEIVTTPGQGTAAVSGGQLTYTADAGASGPDSFTFRATDSGGLSVVGTATVDIGTPNTAPSTPDLALATDEDTPLTLTPVVTDPGDTYNLSVVTVPTHGTAVAGGADIVYTPAADYAGADAFTFQVTDAGGLTLATPALVSLTVNPVNDRPTATSGSLTVNEDTAGMVVPAVTDPDAGDAFTFRVTSTPARGAATPTVGYAAQITYTPGADATGSDSFAYVARDSGGLERPGTVTVTIVPVNDAPQVADLTATTLQDTATPNLQPVITDPDAGDSHTLTIVTGPANGTAQVNGSRITYTPSAGFYGVDTLTFKATDSGGPADSNTATARVSVTGSFATGGTPTDVAFGDFDGDGHPDIAVANAADVVSLFLGDGAGGLSARIDVPPAAGGQTLGAVALAVGRLDGDATDDLVVVHQDDDSYSVALGNAVAASIVTATPVPLGASTFPQAAALADFDGDGKLDLAVAELLADTVDVFAGNGDGTFAAAPTASLDTGASTSPWDVATGDFDGDGNPDVAAVALQPNANNLRWVSVWTGDGTGAFTLEAGDTAALDVQADADLAAADLDGDGFDDAVRTLRSLDQAAVLTGNAAGTLTTHTAYGVVQSAGGAPAGLVLADVDGDGALDLVTANGGGDAVAVLAGAGDGTFGTAALSPAFAGPQAVAAGFLDGNARADTATVHPAADRLGLTLR